MPVTSRCGLLELACSMALYVLQVLGYSHISHEAFVMTQHTWLYSFPLSRCVLKASGLAMKAIPAESRVSASPPLHLMCSAEKFPSIMNVRMSWLLNWSQNHIADMWMNTYDVYLVFQSLGRLMPGWGHAGQNTAIDPSLGWSSSLFARPLCILFCRSRHWRDALRSCLYRFCNGASVHTGSH